MIGLFCSASVRVGSTLSLPLVGQAKWDDIKILTDYLGQLISYFLNRWDSDLRRNILIQKIFNELL